jgi:thiol-disulfide isomerase/thioredoxin
MDRRQKTLIAALLATLIAGQHGLAWSQGTGPNSLAWQPTLEDAKRVAAQTNRLVLVHFWSPGCAPCLQLEQNVFSQPQVQQAIQARFVSVKLNADDWPTTVKAFGVTRLPTDLVITPGGQIVGRMLSPPTADSYLQQLNIAASGTGPAASPTGAAYAAGVMPPSVPVAAAMSPPAAYGGTNPYSAAPYDAVPQTTAPPRYGIHNSRRMLRRQPSLRRRRLQLNRRFPLTPIAAMPSFISVLALHRRQAPPRARPLSRRRLSTMQCPGQRFRTISQCQIRIRPMADTRQ